MKQKNIVTLFFISISAFLLQSCSNGEKPENVATDFLDAYLSTDYAKAAEFCTPELGKDLSEAVRELESLAPEVKELMKRHTSNYTPQITAVEEPKGRDTVIVSYSIINRPKKDSISVGGDVIIEKQLSLVKIEDNWRVAALNNNK
ncbi:MAG: hypothetical protein IKY70_02420 [Bacteroidales bacterium]|nr:hypothetical protein [Bacteroidales bacterium]